MTKICKNAVQHFHCTESKVFTIEKSVVLWSGNIKKNKDLKSYGSAASLYIVTCVKLYKINAIKMLLQIKYQYIFVYMLLLLAQ
jgi:hypothetical protein